MHFLRSLQKLDPFSFIFDFLAFLQAFKLFLLLERMTIVQVSVVLGTYEYLHLECKERDHSQSLRSS